MGRTHKADTCQLVGVKAAGMVEDCGCRSPEGLWTGPLCCTFPVRAQGFLVLELLCDLCDIRQRLWIHSLAGLLPGALGGLSLRWLFLSHVSACPQSHPAPLPPGPQTHPVTNPHGCWSS